MLAVLKQALTSCTTHRSQALVTGPINKAVINDAGIPFTGHTEWLAAQTGTPRVVMMLAAGTLRVALTTHLALREVPDAINAVMLERDPHHLRRPDKVCDYFPASPCLWLKPPCRRKRGIWGEKKLTSSAR